MSKKEKHIPISKSAPDLPRIAKNGSKVELPRNLPKDRLLVRTLTNLDGVLTGDKQYLTPRKPTLNRQYTSVGEFPPIKQYTCNSNYSFQAVKQSTNSSNSFIPNRKTDRDKKWPLRGWDTDDKIEESITGWMKRQTVLESKKGKKRSPRLDLEHYFPVHHKCPSIEDWEQLKKDSLHSVFIPKPKTPETNATTVKLRYTNKFVITPAGFREQGAGDNNDNPDIHTYRDSKEKDFEENSLERRSRSVQDLSKSQSEKNNTYLKIKRLLKFSSKERKTGKREDDDDEGYSSKTSSAETKQGAESDGEEDGGLSREKKRMFSSMVDLSQLPSHSEHRETEETTNTTKSNSQTGLGDTKIIGESVTSRVKFSYTHQPTILQLPDPEVKLAHDSLRIEKRIESEDTNWSYAKLKRNKELNRCYKPDILHSTEDSQVYNLDCYKPVTLVLRKISIQNSDQNIPSVVQSSSYETRTLSPERAQNSLCNNLGLGSNPDSRVGSALSREGSQSRTGSVTFSLGSPVPCAKSNPTTPRNTSPQNNNSNNRCKSSTGRRSTNGLQRVNSAVSQRELLHNLYRSNNVRDVRVVGDNKPKEPMWNHQYSYIDRQAIDRQATNYCIGDLLPAVDKSIYTNNVSKGKLNHKEEDKKSQELTTTELLDINITQIDDGYILLKKGMDLLTGNGEKPTLGPPAFRPNQTRHPLMRNVTVIVSKHDHAHTDAPVSGSKTKQVRVSSDKGPRFNVVDGDKETQKKLKEAFSQFYRNRPKEIGREFRRMQTMWKT